MMCALSSIGDTLTGVFVGPRVVCSFRPLLPRAIDRELAG